LLYNIVLKNYLNIHTILLLI